MLIALVPRSLDDRSLLQLAHHVLYLAVQRSHKQLAAVSTLTFECAPLYAKPPGSQAPRCTAFALWACLRPDLVVRAALSSPVHEDRVTSTNAVLSPHCILICTWALACSSSIWGRVVVFFNWGHNTLDRTQHLASFAVQARHFSVRLQKMVAWF